MSVINRRNAVLGWAAWTAAKQIAKQKAKRQLHLESGGGGKRRVAIPAVVVAVAAAVAGALLFWRHRGQPEPPGADDFAQ